MSEFETPAERITAAAEWLREARHALMEAHTALLQTDIGQSELQTIMNLVGVTRMGEARLRRAATAKLTNTLHVIPHHSRPRTRVQLAADITTVATSLANCASQPELLHDATVHALATMRLKLTDAADDLTPGVDKNDFT